MKTEAAKADYPEFLAKLKERILEARTMAVRAVNHELILLYWDIGQGIVQKQEMEGWGESVIDRLSADLKEAFPHSMGFSSRNLRDMKRFYLVYTDEAIWRHVVAKLDNSTSTKGCTKSTDYARALRVDVRSARRHLSHFAELELVNTIGSGPATEYEVKQ